MTNRSTHSQEDEALAFGEVSAPSSIRSAARADNVIQFPILTAAAWDWEEEAAEGSKTSIATVQLDGCLPVGLGRFLHAFEVSDGMLFSIASNESSPASSSGIKMDSLDSAFAIHTNPSVGLVLRMGSWSQVERPVIAGIAVDMVDQRRDIDQINPMVHRIDNSMLDEVTPPKLDHPPAVAMTCVDLSSSPACVNFVPPFSVPVEVALGPDLPRQCSGNVIKFEAFSKEPDGYVFDFDHDEDGPFSIGELAVRLVADWSLPRLQVFVAADPEGGEPDRLP